MIEMNAAVNCETPSVRHRTTIRQSKNMQNLAFSLGVFVLTAVGGQWMSRSEKGMAARTLGREQLDLRVNSTQTPDKNEQK